MGPVAARRRHRHHGRAAAARLDAGERPAAALLRRAPGPLGGRGRPGPRRASASARFHLDPDGLAEQPGPGAVLSFASPQTTGRAAGEWCGFGAEGEMPPDQRPDDGRSLAFDSAPLAERLEILGAPVVELEIAADAPVALLAVRLCAVQPDGVSSLVTYGVLNLTHRDGPRVARAARARHASTACGVQLNDVATPFRRAAGSGLRSRPTTGRSSGRRRKACSCRCAPDRACSACRCGRRAARTSGFGRSTSVGGAEQPVQDPAPAADAPHRRGRPRHQRDRAHRAYGRVRRGADPHRADRHGPRLHVPQAPSDRRERPPVRPDGDRPEDHDAAHRLDRAGRVPQPPDRDGDNFQFSADLEAFEGDQLFARRTWRIAIPRLLG